MTLPRILHPRLLPGLMLIAALAACNKQPEKQGQVGGEILPGSASDAMLPLDTVTSAPPLAPKQEKGPAGTASEAPAAAAQDVAPEEAPAEPQ